MPPVVSPSTIETRIPTRPFSSSDSEVSCSVAAALACTTLSISETAVFTCSIPWACSCEAAEILSTRSPTLTVLAAKFVKILFASCFPNKFSHIILYTDRETPLCRPIDIPASRSFASIIVCGNQRRRKLSKSVALISGLTIFNNWLGVHPA